MDENIDNKDQSDNFTIGDQTYTLEELQGLISDGQYKREVETKQNTSIDKLQSAYTRLTQEAKDWKAERDEYLKLKENLNKPKDLDEDTIKAAQEEARKLGLITESQFDEIMSKKFPQFYSNQRAGEKLLERVNDLGKELNGEDGRPKFDPDEILGYMRDNGISDPMIAYKVKNEQALDEWKTNQLQNARRDNIPTEEGSDAGSKQPPEVKPSRDNMRNLLKEALRGA